MYPIVSEIENKIPTSDFSQQWVQLIHSDMSFCVNRLKKKKMNSRSQSQEFMTGRMSILKRSASEMLAASI